MMNVARLLFSVTILLTYPIECFVTREVIVNTFFPQDRDCLSDPIVARNATYRHIGFTITIVAITYVISMSTDCLGVVLELNVSSIPSSTDLSFLRDGDLFDSCRASWQPFHWPSSSPPSVTSVWNQDLSSPDGSSQLWAWLCLVLSSRVLV